MDREIRNLIQRATQEVRSFLERDYSEQLEGVYDIRADGIIAAEAGSHLDSAQRVVRSKLIAAVEHIRATAIDPSAAVTGYIREAAFTTLNRFVALKMLEARGLVQECVTRGDQSSGFKEFSGLAPGLVELPDHGYRQYLEAIFDEIGREVRVLFDRRDPASLLWPRRQAFLDLIGVLNKSELSDIWSEDETIGWVYQYFNGDTERKQMRAESQAPRSSRELAVRNQFFTPRYVVEFLADNTLGRTWYEMRRGQTKITDVCKQLIHRPTEIFLDENEPLSTELEREVLAEELINCPTPVPFRAKKDPRDLKVLDPACGSGHFLLYAFDILIHLYEEAWADTNSPLSKETGRRLQDDYATISELHSAAPALILRHNLYGIDIDSRAAQIAALALWMRAQRAYADFGIPKNKRRRISKSNVVVAEPMPGNDVQLQMFVASLESKLGELIQSVFDKMELAGETGFLLKIEDEIQFAIKNIFGASGEIFRNQNQEQWLDAERRLEIALSRYADNPQHLGSYERRLFAEDTVRGLGIIDLCRQRYDVILMNPPFGDSAKGACDYQKKSYPNSHQDIFQCFVERAIDLLNPGSLLGVLSARTGFFMGDSESWRTEVVWKNNLLIFVDLGLGVLDEALVEAAAYTIRRSSTRSGMVLASRHLASRQKEADLRAAVQYLNGLGNKVSDVFIVPQTVVELIPGGVFGYWAPLSFLARFRDEYSFKQNVSQVRQGLATADDFRFARLAWEVPNDAIGGSNRWIRFSKGGEYSPPYDDVHLVVDWGENGEQLRSLKTTRVQNDAWYRKAGSTYTVRTASAFAAKILPKGCIFSHNAQSWFLDDQSELLKSIIYFLTRIPQAYLDLATGGGDTATSGGVARRYTTKAVHSVPASVLKSFSYVEFEEDCKTLLRLIARDLSVDETSCLFSGLPIEGSASLADMARSASAARQRLVTEALRATHRIDEMICAEWQLSDEEILFLRSEIGAHPFEYTTSAVDGSIEALWNLSTEEVIRKGVEKHGALKWLTKKRYFCDRHTELICHILHCSPIAVETVVTRLAASKRELAKELVSHAVGLAFGRWSLMDYGKPHFEAFVQSPFSELPQVSPATNCNPTKGILVDDPGHDDDLWLAIRESIQSLWASTTTDIVEQISSELGVSASTWLRSEFFQYHLAKYSKSRRKAPVYWQLAPGFATFSVWLHYPCLNKETIFNVLNDYVIPKVRHEERKLASIVQDAAGNPTASQRKEISRHEMFVDELANFRNELARVAPLWRPDLNDGVLINFAPLWRLVSHNKSWQKECKACWDGLVAGDFDWSHLAMHLWPERVVPKCALDRSLAIVHKLDQCLWERDSTGKWEPTADRSIVEYLIQERKSIAVKDALKALIDAPSPSLNSGGSKRASRNALSRSRSLASDDNRSLHRRPRDKTANTEVIEKIKAALASNGHDASKEELLEATGITPSEWSLAIKELMADGTVDQSGARRSVRYRFSSKGDGS